MVGILTPGIGLRQVRTYSGPNPYSDEACVVAALDIGPEAIALGPGRCSRIAEAFASWFSPPELDSHPHREEDIVAFLAALSLALLNKEAGYLHTAHAFREGGQSCLCVGYHVAPVAVAALNLAIKLFGRFDSAAPAQIDRALQRFGSLTRQHHPDFQIAFLMRAARRDGIPYGPLLREHRLWLFGWGCNSSVFFESEPKGDSAIGWKLARDKTASKAVFAALGVRTPPHVLASRETDLRKAERTIGWPCVVKPAAGGRSRGVTTDVNSSERLRHAFRHAQAQGKGQVMIERQVEGDVYRINVSRGVTTMIVRRASVRVTGDGRHTVAELIEQANLPASEPGRAESRPGPIAIDDKLTAQLVRQDFSLDAVPASGREVLLSRTALLDGGASYCDVTAQAHPDISTMATLLAKGLGLEYCGIDFVSRDITKSCAEQGAVLEINTTPGLRAAESAGMTPEEIGREVLGDGLGRIPVTLIIAGEADATQVARGLRFGEGQGWVMGERCGLGSFLLGDSSGAADGTSPQLPELAARLLRNPLAASLTIVCTPARLAEAGLPIDRYDRVIVCSAGPDAGWHEVLSRHADRLFEVHTADEALAHLT